MYICNKCHKHTTLPVCENCGEEFHKNGICILTDAPDMNLDDKKIQYIGYEHIGSSYSIGWWNTERKRIELRGNFIARIAGDGLLLDLACGDGQMTIPAAALGCRVIAGDISVKMLNLLRDRALSQGVSMDKITLCRMNALDIPLQDESVDNVIANGVLHLISDPEKVIKEIYRVLKEGGKVISFEDAPGKERQTGNERYYELVNKFHHSYWEIIKSYGINKAALSWDFNKNKTFEELFEASEETSIEYSEDIIRTFNDGFLSRFIGKGFSAQAAVPDNLHKKAVESVHLSMIIEYGEDYGKTEFYGKLTDIKVRIYTKTP